MNIRRFLVGPVQKKYYIRTPRKKGNTSSSQHDKKTGWPETILADDPFYPA
jgi:hypothetical protein